MILSIGIPTFNRCGFLKETLDNLLPQLSGHEHEIELLISDNASEDKTKEVVEEARHKYGFSIDYSCYENGVSGEENFISTCAKCKGKYVFLMGDDDIISPNFIEILMPFLEDREDYVAVHWNRLSGDGDCNNNTLVDTFFDGSTHVTLDPSGFVQRVIDYPNFMSSIIFRKDVLEMGKDYFLDSYFGYRFFAQMYFGIVLSGGKCLYYYFPLVIQRNPTKSWMKFWPQYFISSSSNIFHDLNRFVPGVYNKWRGKLNKGISDCLPLVGCYRKYYKQVAIRDEMFKHLRRGDIIRYYYYLLPGSFFLYRCKKKLSFLLFRSKK